MEGRHRVEGRHRAEDDAYRTGEREGLQEGRRFLGESCAGMSTLGYTLVDLVLVKLVGEHMVGHGPSP